MDNFPYQHIIWDWNGTLFDDAWLCVEIMNEMLAQYGLPALTLSRYETIFDFPVERYYRALGYDFDADPFEKLSDEYMAHYNARMFECRLHDGAREALAAARRRGVTQSVLSAMHNKHLPRLMEHLGVRDLFTDVVGLPDHHARGKVETGKRWIAGQALPPEAMLFVGDTTHDYEVAEALGVDAALVHSGHHSRARLAATGARLLPSLAALFE
jgi:phosphoglycolate phosphatase